MVGYLAPYKGQRYHRDHWNGANTIFATPQELFNYKHSSLRNVIERCFGVLKARFPIWKSMPNYSLARQPSIVTACCVVHNMIVIHKGRDEYFDGYMEADEWEGDSDDGGGGAGQVELVNTSLHSVQTMGKRRDDMAIAMWDAY
ncbi:uncharacterized protein LOC131329093 [Rhododendron vialii]|uniref:uncharacterized protein LOC131329093 n=1 Tax=Rhododendron vialii TaxID=182163 RepID=UPI0026602836|nr:uncharacterized protein LOC131329093 [Rhododendron vialii]